MDRVGAWKLINGNTSDVFRAVVTVATLCRWRCCCCCYCCGVESSALLWQLVSTALCCNYADMVTRLPATCDSFYPVYPPPNAAWQSSPEHTSCHSTHTHTPTHTCISCMCVSLVRAWANESFASRHANNLMSSNVRCKILFNTPTHSQVPYTHTSPYHTHPHTPPHTHTQSPRNMQIKKTLHKKSIWKTFYVALSLRTIWKAPGHAPWLTPTPCHASSATGPLSAPLPLHCARYA